MGKKFTEKDYGWVSKKGFEIWRSQLNISGFTPEEKKLFLNFWKGRDAKDNADHIFGELERFQFRKYKVEEEVNLPLYVRINPDTKGLKFSNWENESKFKDSLFKLFKIGTITVPNFGKGIMKFEGKVVINYNHDKHPEKKIEFSRWVLLQGSAYYSDSTTGMETPYSVYTKFNPENKPSNREIFESFGIEGIESYSDIVSKVNVFIENYIRENDLSELFKNAEERSKENVSEMYAKYGLADKKENKKLEKEMADHQALMESSSVYNKIFINKETPTVDELLKTWELFGYTKYHTFLERNHKFKGGKFDHFNVYFNFSMKIWRGEVETSRSGKKRVWVNPYDGIEEDYQKHLEKLSKNYKEWENEFLAREVENHSFR